MKTIYFLDVNPKAEPLTDTNDRRALSGVLDRKGMAGVILNGRGRVEDNTGANTGAKKKRLKSVKELELWYPSSGRAPQLVAEKIAHDLAGLGLRVKPVRKNIEELPSFSADAAPAFILRNLSLMLDMPETLEKTLYSPKFKSAYAAIGLRVDAKIPREKNIVFFLFSQSAAYLRQNGIQRFSVGTLNEIDLQNIYLRKRSK